MSELVFLLFALALIVAYLLLTGGDGYRARPQSAALDQLAAEAMRQIREIEEESRRVIAREARRRLR